MIYKEHKHKTTKARLFFQKTSFICFHLTLFWRTFISNASCDFGFTQMPRVMDRRSEGIDLHFWGRVLKAASERIQVVSIPEGPAIP